MENSVVASAARRHRSQESPEFADTAKFSGRASAERRRHSAARPIGDLNIGRSSVIAPAPATCSRRTAHRARAAPARDSGIAGGPLQVVPPPPSVSAAGVCRSVFWRTRPRHRAEPASRCGRTTGPTGWESPRRLRCHARRTSRSLRRPRSRSNRRRQHAKKAEAHRRGREAAMYRRVFTWASTACENFARGGRTRPERRPQLRQPESRGERPSAARDQHTVAPMQPGDSDEALRSGARPSSATARFYSLTLNMPNLNSARRQLGDPLRRTRLTIQAIMIRVTHPRQIFPSRWLRARSIPHIRSS